VRLPAECADFRGGLFQAVALARRKYHAGAGLSERNGAGAADAAAGSGNKSGAVCHNWTQTI
jgi:hypothetical protein